MKKGQTTIEYLLLLGGVILVGAIVLAIASGIVGKTGPVVAQRVNDNFCAPYLEPDCGLRDPDGAGPLGSEGCQWKVDANACRGCLDYNAAGNKCIVKP